MYCKKCGSLILDGFSVCLNCGAEVKENLPENKEKIKIIEAMDKAHRNNQYRKTIITVLLALIVSAIFFFKYYEYSSNLSDDIANADSRPLFSNNPFDKADSNDTKEPETVDTLELVQRAEAEYYSNLVDATYTILDGCVDAEKAGNLISKVWYNSIYKEHDPETDKYTMENGVFFEDFNDALYKLDNDPDFIALCDKISSNQYEVIDLMRKLNEPPKKYADAYAVIKDYYSEYIKFTNLILYYSESYNSFTEKFSTYDDSTLYLYKQMLIYF